jgi:Protein of unknown function (DUF2934)
MPKKSTTLQDPPSPENGGRSACLALHNAIASRAHQIFLERGAAPGRELDDWLQAERELTVGATPSSPRRSASAVAPLAHPRSTS